MPHLVICFEDWQSRLKNNNTPSKGLKPKSKVKWTPSFRMGSGNPLNVILCNWWQTKGLSFVRLPGKQESFSKNL